MADFADGSMGPKVRAACEFVERGGKFAAVGSIDAPALLAGTAGTAVTRTTADLIGAGAVGEVESREGVGR